MPDINANGDKILYADYTSQGFNLHEMDLDPQVFIPLDQVRNNKEQKYLPSREDETRARSLLGQALETYDVKPFRKITDLVNPHTWIPLYTDIENPDFQDPEVHPGAMLFSQNKLSTATAMLGYEYRDRDHYFHTSFTWSGWYPVVKVSYDFGGMPFVAQPPDNVPPLTSVRTDMDLGMEVYLPLNLTTNRYVTGMRPSVEARLGRTYLYYSSPPGYRDMLTFIDYRLYIYNYLKTSGRDIMPRFGQTIDLRHLNTPFESEQIGSQTYLSAGLYLPGLLRHHSLRIRGTVHRQFPDRYIMGNLSSMPRGYEQQSAIMMRKLSTDYVFPIWYPDLNIWHAAYFKRLKGGLFLDHAFATEVYLEDGVVNKHFTSLGGELTTDVHLAHLIFPMNIGGRLIYKTQERTLSAELIFSVDLNQF
jgi:hypothetical protein